MNEYITIISLSLNAMFLLLWRGRAQLLGAAIWAWIRRVELLEAAIAVKNAWEDEKITDEEYRIILKKFEAIAQKGS